MGSSGQSAERGGDAGTVDLTQLEALLRLSERATEAELLEAATRTVVALLGDRGSTILLEGRPWVAFSTYAPTVVAGAAFDLELVLGRYPEIAEAASELVPVVIDDVQGDPRLAAVRPLVPRHLLGVVVVPITSGRRAVGVIHVQTLERHRTVEPHALATAAFVARLTGTLLETVRLRALQPTALQLDTEKTIPQTGAQAREAAAPVAPIAPERTERVAGPVRLLLVEDDADQAEVVAELLGREGYEVTVAGNGADALYLARTIAPTLILLDVGLPVVDGYEVAVQLSEDELTCDVPILFLSAADDLMQRVRQLRLGAVDFLAKPFPYDALIARVERALLERDVRERLRSASYQDQLTGLYNLRFLQERFAIEQARCQRYGIPLSIVMLDVDRLKQVNDQHGHEVGSQLLAAVGQVLRAGTRETDIPVRYGGDEFVVVLPHATEVEAVAFGERVLLQLDRVALPGGVKASASIGVASWVRGGPPIGDLLARADAAAYESKRQGGHRVSAAATARAS